MESLKERYQKYKTLYENNNRELTTYATRVTDACTRINNSIKRLKEINNLTSDAMHIKEQIDALPECTEENVREVAITVKKCYDNLEAYCNMLINDIID